MPTPQEIRDAFYKIGAELLSDSSPTPNQRGTQTITQAAIEAGSPLEYSYNPQTRKFDISLGGISFEADDEEAAIIIGMDKLSGVK